MRSFSISWTVFFSIGAAFFGVRTGGNAFFQYQVPAAVITLKQGFGRLIRSLHDRGLLVLLDNRILKKQYGKVFLESLPKYRRTTQMADVEKFFGVE